MNTLPGNIIVDSCQYTPVYLVQETGAIQGKSYVFSQGNGQEVKPVTDNLKRFYENSGIFENNLVNNVPNVTKPRILKKQYTKPIKNGNNLKLASLLLPKNNQDHNLNINKQCLPVNSVILKPTIVTPNIINPVPREHPAPREDVDRKIVKIKNFPECLKMVPREKPLPKIKPKEEPPSTPPIKYTSVQLLKLGDTYHSINQLSDEQMKMVNKALKIFSDPEKTMEPLYDPVTNTRYVYKVVSPRDLTVVGNNKIVMNDKSNEVDETKKERKKVKPLRVAEKEILVKKLKPLQVKEPPVQEKEKPVEIPKDVIIEPEQQEEIKVTRSGRKVKLPKQIVPEISQKPKKKPPGVVSCFQCATDFCSFYRLQKHYENFPAHIPANIHTNLFHCLLAIIKSGSEEDKANIFIQQLEHLVEKLKSILPCLLKQIDGNESKSCTINDDIGRLFGLNPGSYNLNMDGLSCVKDKDGNCRHYPSMTTQVNLEANNKQGLSTQSDENKPSEGETEDCARINPVDKWPNTKKRIWKTNKHKAQDDNAKKMRLASENSDPMIELELENLINFSTIEQSAIDVQPKVISLLDELDLDVGNEISNLPHLPSKNDTSSNLAQVDETKKVSTGPHTQFHSTHFDIRSSPMKPSAAIFRKIQINPEKMPKYEVQIIRPIGFDDEQEKSSENSTISNIAVETPDLHSLFKDDIIQLSPCKQPSLNLHELNFDTTKDWILDTVNDKSNESFLRTNSAIEPSLLHIQGDKLQLDNLVESNEQLGDADNRLLSSKNSSVLNFLESLGNECLLYPETDIRNNHVESVDFQLDLFSFSNP